MGSVDTARAAGPKRRSRLPRLLATAGIALTALAPMVPAEASGLAPDAPTGPAGAWAGYSVGVPARHAAPPGPGLTGVDVSGHQGAVDWAAARDGGARFAYVKATEGSEMTSDQFRDQYFGASRNGLLHGAYHFARPDRSSGAVQANYFLDHGGRWAADPRVLPGALDIERNPYGEPCYGLDPQALSAWIAEFNATYRARTGHFPLLYTTTNWWNRCTGANPDFARSNPLWIARYGPGTGPLPAGWREHALWQFADKGPLPGDQNSFNGALEQLHQLAA